MSNEVQTWESQNQYLVSRGIDQPKWNALCSTVYPGAKPDSIVLAIDYCAARGLDVMLKPVHLVPMQVKDAQTGNKEWRDVPMPGIGLYRIQADRSGNYAGSDDPEFGPTITGEFQDAYDAKKTHTIKFPEWCKYTVYKIIDGNRVPFSAREYWLENYATQKATSDCPNAMWKKRPFGQLQKCAEAQALRKAWPEIGSEPTAEEMEGHSELRDVTPVEQPKQSNTLKHLMETIPEEPLVTQEEQQALTEPEPEKVKYPRAPNGSSTNAKEWSSALKIADSLEQLEQYGKELHADPSLVPNEIEWLRAVYMTRKGLLQEPHHGP